VASGAATGANFGYSLPSPEILEVLRAPFPAQALVSPRGSRILLHRWERYPAISQVAEPFLRLAGVRVEPKTRRKHDTNGGYGVTQCAKEFRLVPAAEGTGPSQSGPAVSRDASAREFAGGRERTGPSQSGPAVSRDASAREFAGGRERTGPEVSIALPAGCVESPLWSADDRYLAFRTTTESGVELWVADAATGKTRRVGSGFLNPMLGTSTVQWLPDQSSLLVKLVPENAGRPPEALPGSEGPGIQETDGKTGERSTYEARDTLTNAHDEALFVYYATSQLARIDVTTGKQTNLGRPDLHLQVDIAPDGKHLLVQTMVPPFSHATTFERFPREVAVWDDAGNLLKTLAKLPLADRVPVHGVPTGPRSFAWQETAPATVVWAEALDGGDWKATVPARDRLFAQAAPFTEAPTALVTLPQRFSGFRWVEDGKTVLIREYDENRHWTRTLAYPVATVVRAVSSPPLAVPGGRVATTPAPLGAGKVLFDHSWDEHYAHPGTPVMRVRADGTTVVALRNGSIFLAGDGSSPAGDRPFLDRLTLATGRRERLFRSAADAYERFLALSDGDETTFLTWHQSKTAVPNAFLQTVGVRQTAAAGEGEFALARQAITHASDPTPQIRGIQKQLIKYKRKDGIDLSFTLYTPPNYSPGTKLPAILYAYPSDFAAKETAGQVTGSEQMFSSLSRHQLLLLAGYALIEDAQFPIVGDPKTAYDTYLEQLIDNATAAVDKAVATGVVDRNRIGVTGHSHGALMTVNLLAYSTLFQAGVATSGGYNKTLTPFGFQSERRSVWAAPSVYTQVSPFFVADRIKRPILLMHGTDDANPGTTPLQSQKLFEAIRGNGGTTRLVLLPHEPHWYASLESNEQLAYEMVRWFDRYVKNAAP
jgi:dipeptidyl aminopeptidase/acylaminoacyl peptidase